MKLARDSLKHRLVLLSLLAIGLVWMATLGFSYHDARGEIDRLFDAHLAQAAALLVAQSEVELDELDTRHTPEASRYVRSVSFQVWRRGQTLSLHSANAPDEALGSSTEGFADRTVAGTRWRVFSAWDHDHENLIHVGEQTAARDKVLREMLENLVRPLLVALPVLAVVLWLAIHTGLRPMRRVTEEIARRHPEHLEPVDVTGAPAEIRPLITQLNQLLGRVARSLDSTRRFTADAAHELRTPLAAIRAQAQVALASERQEERRHALQQALRGCDLATHLIEQLLTLARLDASVTAARETLDVRALASEAVADIAPAALAKEIDIALEDGESVRAPLQAGLIRVLLRNLLDNAVRYSPAGSEVSVAVHRADDKVCIEVSDNGPGIPEELRKRVFDRFYRVTGNEAQGSGLGLSIVRCIVDIHDGEITLSPREQGRGLQVSVYLPTE